MKLHQLVLVAAMLILAGMLAACTEGSTTPLATVEATIAVPTPELTEPVMATSEPTTPPATATPEAEPPSAEEAIYAAVIRQIYTVDHTFGDNPPNWPRLYVLDATDDTVAGAGDEDGHSRTLPGEMQQSITALLADLPTELQWVPSWDDVPIDETNGEIDGGEGAIITLGNIYEQEDGSVQVPAGLHCGGLCAAGMTYVLEETDSGWTVTGFVGPMWISQNSARRGAVS